MPDPHSNRFQPLVREPPRMRGPGHCGREREPPEGSLVVPLPLALECWTTVSMSSPGSPCSGRLAAPGDLKPISFVARGFAPERIWKSAMNAIGYCGIIRARQPPPTPEARQPVSHTGRPFTAKLRRVKQDVTERLWTIAAHAAWLRHGQPPLPATDGLSLESVRGSQIVKGCSLSLLEPEGDERGSLIALEGTRDVPFAIKRVYYLFGTVAEAHRGFHAHRNLEQFAVCISGSCIMKLNDGRSERDVLLDDPHKGVFIGPMLWHEMREFSPDAILMVLASDYYDEADYIRNYDEFLSLCNDGLPG
jgi:dTDP-4-dehydrorhamnose 3,5-epimerase-like enzyme